MLSNNLMIYKYIKQILSLAIALLSVAVLMLFEKDKEPIQDITAHKYNIRILDGDTFSTIISNGDRIKIRLYGVDCPEKDQPRGQEATNLSFQFLSSKIKLYPESIDRYGRTVAIVTQNNGISLQESLLLAGLAWVDDRFCKQAMCNDWRNIQTIAKASKRGLWSEHNPLSPWDWRKGRK